MADVIGLTGVKGSGKDTAGQVLKAGGYQEIKMAGALKEMTRTYLYYQGVDSLTVERMMEGDLKEEPSEYMEGKTPREFMQYLGTEFGRERIGENIWVNSAMRRAKTMDKVYCTDIRYPNEAAALASIGGRLYRIERDTDVNAYSLHESEKHIPTLPVDGILDNHGTIDDLHNEVKCRFFPDADLAAMLAELNNKVTIQITTTVNLESRAEWWDEFQEGTITPARQLELTLDQLKNVDVTPLTDTIWEGAGVSMTGRVL